MVLKLEEVIVGGTAQDRPSRISDRTSPATAVRRLPRREDRRKRRLRVPLAVLVVLLAALITVPGTATATHTSAGPAWDFVTMFPPNPYCNPNSPGFVDLYLQTPFGAFPAHYCKNASNQGGPVSGTFRLQVNTFPLDGIVTVSGSVVCLTVSNHTAWERDLITITNSALLLPYGFGVFSELVDNNSVSQSGNQIAPVPAPDQGAMFLTPPPGASPSCPAVGVPSLSPVIAGSVVVHD